MDKDNKNIEYLKGGGSDYSTAANGYPVAVNNSLALFLMGGTGADGRSYPKVDMSLWDQVTMCGTCHVGGAFYEHDRQGNRLPGRLFADWGAAMKQTGPPNINPVTTTVWENYDAATGADKSFATFAPWAYPQYVGNDPSGLFISNGSTFPQASPDGTSSVPAGTQTGLNPQKPWLQSHGHNGKW